MSSLFRVKSGDLPSQNCFHVYSTDRSSSVFEPEKNSFAAELTASCHQPEQWPPIALCDGNRTERVCARSVQIAAKVYNSAPAYQYGLAWLEKHMDCRVFLKCWIPDNSLRFVRIRSVDFNYVRGILVRAARAC